MVIRGIRIFFFLLYLIFFVLASALLALFTLMGGTIAYLMPLKAWREPIIRFLRNTPLWWTCVCNTMLMIAPPKHQWVIQGNGNLDAKQSYLLMANHQAAIDILVLGFVFNKKTPGARFFMKYELLWQLPLLGAACWIIGYPFMRRHSRKQIQKNPQLKFQDIATAKKSSHKFKQYPTTIINFVEGTRFTPKKQSQQGNPYSYLLKPKAGGVSIVLKELQDCLAGILNVTIHYSQAKMSLLDFFFGKPGKITIHYELIPLSANLIGDYYEDRAFRVYFQRWLNEIWKQKDQLMMNF